MTDTTAVAGTASPDAGEPTTTEANVAGTTLTTAATDAHAPATEDQKTAAPEAPEVYDLQMPEGVELDKEATEEFVNIAKSLNLSQESAQKLATIAAKIQQKQADAQARQVETWVEQVKTDTEIGGDKLDENLGIARKALDTFGSPELKDVLNASGLGNHPAVIKAFYKAGKAISEDRFVAGSAKTASTDPAKTMFPSLN